MTEPAANPESPDVNALLDEARIPFLLKAASIALAGAGLLVLLLGVQNVTLVSWTGSYMMLPIALIGFGAVGIGVAAKLVRGRAWSLPASIAAAVLLVLGSGVFFVVASLSGLFTLLSLLGVGGSVTSLVFALLAVGPFRRLLATRRKLRDAGYDLDL